MEELNAIFAAASEIEAFIVAQGWRHCFIGGLAIQRWGEPRLTRDADCSLLTGFGGEEAFVDTLLGAFGPSRDHAREIALRHRVLFLKASNGVHLDVAFAAIPFEEHCVGRATRWPARAGLFLTTCSAEDLIVHKAFANRDRDWVDIEGVLVAQKGKLNMEQVLEELAPLAELKEADFLVLKLKNLATKYGVK